MTWKLPDELEIKNCYDSHVHWQGTGGFANRLDLSRLKSAEDIKTLKVNSSHLRGEWLLGHGWDENLWVDGKSVHREILDQVYPGVPVKFSRTDSHAAWVSTEALKRAGLFYKNVPDPEGGRIYKDNEGLPTGLLIDMAIQPVDHLIPKQSASQIRSDLVAAMKIFNSAGFTHIRDMTCDEVEWNLKTELAESGELTLAVEQSFHCYSANEFPSALRLAFRAKKDHHPLLRPVGTKVFLDGALGSEGAYLSQPYQSGSGRGVLLQERIALKEMIAESWSRNLQISIHCIGDEAAHLAVTVACELWDMGEEGHLNIEHAQMLRLETIEKMKGRPITCHMQPSHWLSDKRWLKKKLGPLYSHVFPWARLEEGRVPFFFGSDSPIEPVDISLSYRALEDAEKNGIAPTRRPVAFYHGHPDVNWVKDCRTLFAHGKTEQVYFQGKLIHLS